MEPCDSDRRLPAHRAPTRIAHEDEGSRAVIVADRPEMPIVAESEHRTAVTAWYERVASEGSVASLIQTFETTFASLWQRSHLVLGEVTLTAIVDRVLHTAVEQHPCLAPLEVDALGIRCLKLRSQYGLRREEVSAAIQCLLVEFLTVLGDLTAEILSPELHAQLSEAQMSAQDYGIIQDEAS